MGKQIELSDGFVVLRRYHESDVDELFLAVRESLPDLSPWYAWGNENYAIEGARQFIRDQGRWWDNGEVYNFAITDEKTGTYCGGCLLNNINLGDRFANMAYWVRSSWTGRGVATASVRLVAKFGYDQLRLNRVEIVVAQGNLASMRVAEKSGAKREGELRSRIAVRDKVYDAVLFSLIPEDL